MIALIAINELMNIMAVLNKYVKREAQTQKTWAKAERIIYNNKV